MSPGSGEQLCRCGHNDRYEYTGFPTPGLDVILGMNPTKMDLVQWRVERSSLGGAGEEKKMESAPRRDVKSVPRRDKLLRALLT